MKKVLLVALCILMLTALVACGGNNAAEEELNALKDSLAELENLLNDEGAGEKGENIIDEVIDEIVPDELIDTYTSCTVRFGFDEDFGGSRYDDLDECDYLYEITVTK